MPPDLFVTKPYLPALEDYLPYLEEIWRTGQVTNGGKFHAELEVRLAEKLRAPQVSLVNNGTLALVIALQSMGIKGEVITTPVTFPATVNSLKWCNIDPVFVDIDRHTYNIDPAKIEAAITPRTTAILPVHVYGRPCKLQEIESVAKRYNLRVIYDAAHAFGVDCDCGKLFTAGDHSALSFHATKVFHTFEGGAIISKDLDAKTKIDRLKNFGFVNDTNIAVPGINSKLNELQAAMGLLQLDHLDFILARRKKIDLIYREALSENDRLYIPPEPKVRQYNYCYFPIEIQDTAAVDRDQLFQSLVSEGISARRYFYPLVSNFSIYRSEPSSDLANLPMANDAARKVLCLPIYPDLKDADVERVIEAVTRKL